MSRAANRVARNWNRSGQLFQVRQGVLREHLVIQVRMQREVNEAQRFSAVGGQRVTAVRTRLSNGSHL
jgi:hypothetical protein